MTHSAHTPVAHKPTSPRPLAAAGRASLALLLPFLASGLHAQETAYAYGGFSVGQARAKLEAERNVADRLPAGVLAEAISKDERDTGYKLFLGYQMNRNWALEAGYFQLGRFSLAARTQPTGQLDGRFDMKGVNLDLVGSLPLAEGWSVLGRIGAQFNRTRTHFEGSGAALAGSGDPSRRDSNLKIGAGLQYAMGSSMALRAELERYRVRDALGQHIPVQLLSLSLVFPFGGAAAAPRYSAAPAAYSAAPARTALLVPPPAPAALPLPANPSPQQPMDMQPMDMPPTAAGLLAVPRRISFSAESLFDFDVAELRPQGVLALDALALELRGADFQAVTVAGHTDRLGSSDYNQRLSLQRADAVKRYLVETAGIPAHKISAVGRSETMPLTRSADCAGLPERSDALRACLQPDRRVEVEVLADVPAQR